MKKLPLDQSVSKQQAIDLLNLTHSLIDRYLPRNSNEVNELYELIDNYPHTFINKFLKIRINNYYEHIHREFEARYNRIRLECQERQDRITRWSIEYKDQIPAGFPKSPVMDLNECINIFHHNHMLMQYEIEFQNMVLLDKLRQSFCISKQTNTNGNITYLFGTDK